MYIAQKKSLYNFRQQVDLWHYCASNVFRREHFVEERRKALASTRKTTPVKLLAKDPHLSPLPVNPPSRNIKNIVAGEGSLSSGGITGAENVPVPSVMPSIGGRFYIRQHVSTVKAADYRFDILRVTMTSLWLAAVGPVMPLGSVLTGLGPALTSTELVRTGPRYFGSG